VALITGASTLEIISDVGVNYLFDDYVVSEYVTQGVEAIDLDLGAALLISSGTVSVAGTKIATGVISSSISCTISVEALETSATDLSITSSITSAAVKTAVGTSNLAISANISASAIERDFGAAVIISSGSITVDAVQTTVAEASLAITSNVQAGVTTDADISADISATLTANAVITAVGSTNPNIIMTISADVVRVINAASTLSISAGTVVVGTEIDVDPYNVFKVLQETRLNTIKQESNEFIVMQETRDFAIKRPVLTGAGLRRNS